MVPAAPPPKPSSHVLDIIDRMIAAPALEKPVTEPAPNRHAGAAAASAPPVPPPAPLLAPKGITVERTGGAKDALDEAAELFKVIFKGEIVP